MKNLSIIKFTGHAILAAAVLGSIVGFADDSVVGISQPERQEFSFPSGDQVLHVSEGRRAEETGTSSNIYFYLTFPEDNCLQIQLAELRILANTNPEVAKNYSKVDLVYSRPDPYGVTKPSIYAMYKAKDSASYDLDALVGLTPAGSSEIPAFIQPLKQPETLNISVRNGKDGKCQYFSAAQIAASAKAQSLPNVVSASAQSSSTYDILKSDASSALSSVSPTPTEASLGLR